MLGALFFDVSEVLIKNDPVFTGKRNEALAARAADQCEIRLACKLDAPQGIERERGRLRLRRGTQSVNQGLIRQRIGE